MSPRSDREDRTRGRGWPRLAGWVGGVLGALLLAGVLALVVWSQVGVLTAEPAPLAEARSDERIRVADEGRAIVISPASRDASGVGLVFLPGGKVQPEAYVAKLSGVVAEAGLTVVITRPWLNLAFLDPRGLDSFTALAPGVDAWMVGGHSLGGVRACSLAGGAEALVHLASYCGTDVSGSSIPVLSIGGDRDELSTPGKIAAAAHLLPPDAEFVQLPGASHASFGDYGIQPGDGAATITDEEMSARLTRLLAELAAGIG